jgi:hypothetical protein
LTLAANGLLYLVWQDQRLVDEESRNAAPSNADAFACALSADGVCGDVQQLTQRTSPEVNASRPQVVADGNRLVATWSIYEGTTPEALESAQRVEWSQIALDGDNAAWSEPQTVIARESDLIGGRLVDLAVDPNGGAVLVYGRSTTATVLYLERLQPDSNDWSEPLPLISGDRGSFPSVEVGQDGTVYVVYNIGSTSVVQVGAVALAPGQDRASAETVVSQAEDGAQGRAVLDIDNSGRLWVIYLREPTGGVANEVRTLRGAIVPSEPAAEAPATPVPATPAPAEPVATPQA